MKGASAAKALASGAEAVAFAEKNRKRKRLTPENRRQPERQNRDGYRCASAQLKNPCSRAGLAFPFMSFDTQTPLINPLATFRTDAKNYKMRNESGQKLFSAQIFYQLRPIEHATYDNGK